MSKLEINNSQLLEVGLQFGHQTKRWNPKMAPYIYTKRKGIHIIDLQKARTGIDNAYTYLEDLIAKTEGNALFVGTKKQATESVKIAAKNAGAFHITSSWKGGTLTNNKVVRKSIQKMEKIEKMEEDGTFELLPKKEVIQLKKDYVKLEKNFGGIREMRKMPQVVVVFDIKSDINAVLEAKKLNIPVVALVDTNDDPDLVDVIIPGNNDAIGAIKLTADIMANAILAGKGEEILPIETMKKPKRDNNRAPRRDFRREAPREA